MGWKPRVRFSTYQYIFIVLKFFRFLMADLSLSTIYFLYLRSRRRCSSASDPIERLKVQSCRRRSARLDRKTKTNIVLSHRRTKEQKVGDYYKMLEEQKLLEMSAAAKKLQVQYMNTRFTGSAYIQAKYAF